MSLLQRKVALVRKVEIVKACYADIVFVARNMRKMDKEEIYPLIYNPSPENLAAFTIAVGGISMCANFMGRPVAVFGAGEVRPRNHSVWMFATPKWPKVALSVTRYIKKILMPNLIKLGSNRAECFTLKGHNVAQDWLSALGAKRESTLDDYGPERKTYYCYSWTRKRLEKEGKF